MKLNSLNRIGKLDGSPGSGKRYATIYDPVLGSMKVLVDADGKPVKDDDGKYIYIKKES